MAWLETIVLEDANYRIEVEDLFPDGLGCRLAVESASNRVVVRLSRAEICRLRESLYRVING